MAAIDPAPADPPQSGEEADTIGPVRTRSNSTREFGVEFECIMRWKGEIDQEELFNQFGKRLCAFGVDALAPSDEVEYRRYEYGYVVRRSKWFLEDDASVSVESGDFRYSRERRLYPTMSAATWDSLWHSVELVSPILNENSWDQVQLVMQLMRSRPFAVYHNTTCSTHIHVGIQDPEEGKITDEDALADLQKVAAVWSLFEMFLNFHFPESRVNQFCKRTYRTPWAKQAGLDEFLYDVGTAASFDILLNLMNHTFAAGGPSPTTAEFVSSRYFGANFINITSKKKWTVEFRSLEGVKDFNTVQLWGKLLMRLYDQAVGLQWKDIDDIAQKVSALRGPQDEGFFGREEGRDNLMWMKWLSMMHPLFILTLSSTEALLKLGIETGNPESLTHLLDTWVMEDGMNLEQSQDPDYVHIYPELQLLKRISDWLVQRRNKYFSQFEDFFEGVNWLDWRSERYRPKRDEDYINHPNPSGVVADPRGKDIRIDTRQEPVQQEKNWARFPKIFEGDPGEEEIPIPIDLGSDTETEADDPQNDDSQDDNFFDNLLNTFPD